MRCGHPSNIQRASATASLKYVQLEGSQTYARGIYRKHCRGALRPICYIRRETKTEARGLGASRTPDTPHDTTRLMPDVISDYQKWKAQGENLKTQAKHAMESRYRELLTEAASLAEEYRADFGAVLKPPSNITAFRYKASGKAKARKPGKAPAAKSAEIGRPKTEAPKPDPKVSGLQKRLVTAKKKLDDAKAAGGSTRAIEDRIYEIEDALRLAGQPT